MDKIAYKEFYNEDRELPEPKWGEACSVHTTLQCPWCNSIDMYYSGSADNPEEISGDSVRCKNCGHITDWYDAYIQGEHHLTDTVREVIGRP